MATELKNIKRKYENTEAGLTLLPKQWGYAEDTRRLTVMEDDGTTPRRFWDATRLADQTTSYGTALMGTPGIAGVTPSGGSSGAAATLQAMLAGGLGVANANFLSTAPNANSRNVVQPSGDFYALALRNNAAQANALLRFESSAGVPRSTVNASGEWSTSWANAGATNTLTVDNTDNTNAASHARHLLRTGGSSGGDPFTTWQVNAGGAVSFGIDNSDSDAAVLSMATALGTTNAQRWTSAGTTIPGTLGVTGQSTLGAVTIQGNAALFSTSANQILFADASNFMTSSANLAWNGTTLGLTGAQTISSTLAVTGQSTLTGLVGMGSAPLSGAALIVNNSALTGTIQYGVLSQSVFSSAATTMGKAGHFALRTADAVFTMAEGIGVHIITPGKGVGSTITTAYGLKIEDQTVGGTNYAIHTGVGLVQFGGAVTHSGTLLQTGVATFTAAPVFSSVAASQFLLVDGSKALTSVAGTGSGSVVRATSPTLSTITDSNLAGTGTRLVTATSAGLLGNATTIAGAYTFSGDLTIQRSDSGNRVQLYIANQSDSASSSARLTLSVAGVSAGDAVMHYSVSGATEWSVGLDNSDLDKFKISRSTGLGTNDALSIGSDGVEIAAGTSAAMAKVGGALYSSITDAANSSSTETTLHSYTLPANALGANGDSVRIRSFGFFAANANSKVLKIKLGGVLIHSTAGSHNGESWVIDAEIFREALGAQKAIAKIHFTSSGATTVMLSGSDTLTLDLTANQLIEITGQGSASGDVIAWATKIEYAKA